MQSTPEERLDAGSELNEEIKDDSQNFSLSCQENEIPLPPGKKKKKKGKNSRSSISIMFMFVMCLVPLINREQADGLCNMGSLPYG